MTTSDASVPLKNLYIVSAGGFAREVFWLANYAASLDGRYRVAGFLDDRPHLLDGLNYPVPIVSSVEDFEPGERDFFILPIASYQAKRHYRDLLLKKNADIGNMFHPHVAMTPHTKFGRGVIIAHNVSIACETVIGDLVCINSNVAIGHDVRIDEGCHINSFVFIGGGSHIEAGVTIHPHAVVLPNSHVKAGSTVGAGSVVLKTVKENQTVFGVPALPVYT
ncbi:MAG: NeuD/PglB/VioB family sugar acetyltransferase [Vampirovibrionales bacterium]|nr:NeuD/PglB/VioB family sugar acetyltransferase [Vampirovibrionales bacterium]